MAIGVVLASISLAACSGKHDDTASANSTAADGGTASVALAASTPKPGLWQMTVSADAMPKPMVTQMCVGAPAPGTNPFAPPPQPGQTCAKNAFTKTAAGYAIDMECKVNGMTMSSKGEVSGDLSSHYTIAMKSQMGGPGIPAAMQTERASTVEAKYVGACPAGMAPGTAKQAG